MPESIYAVYGASGFGREVMPLARLAVDALGVPHDRLLFVDDDPVADVVNGYRAITYDELLRLDGVERHVALAISDGAIREKLSRRLEDDGVQPWTLRHPTTVVMDEVEVGEGAIICPFATLTSNVRIGRQFQANIYSYVAHDCVVGDFVTLAPRACLNGNVLVEDHAYIGTSAMLRQGTPGQPLVIGRGAVVGMGAVVVRDVPPGATVVGNPARILGS